MKLYFDYKFLNWNEYIKVERTNKFLANKIKQQQKNYIRLKTIGKKYTGKYPVELVVKPHFKDKRHDLDNTNIKGLLDGLVSAKVIENDNLTKIQRIVYEPIFDNKTGIEVEISEL